MFNADLQVIAFLGFYFGDDSPFMHCYDSLCMWYAYMYVFMCGHRPNVDVRCISRLLSTLFIYWEAGPLAEPGVPSLLV